MGYGFGCDDEHGTYWHQRRCSRIVCYVHSGCPAYGSFVAAVVAVAMTSLLANRKAKITHVSVSRITFISAISPIAVTSRRFAFRICLDAQLLQQRYIVLLIKRISPFFTRATQQVLQYISKYQ